MHPDLSNIMMLESEEPNEPGGEKAPSPKNIFNLNEKARKVLLAVSIVLIVILAINYNFFAAPAEHPGGTKFAITSGMTISEAAEYLSENNIIKSPTVFKTLVFIMGGRSGVIAGSYFIEHPVSVFRIAMMVTTNGYGIKMYKVTIPEGLSNRQIADLLAKNLDNFDKAKFLKLAKDKEGYLFPDSYFFEPESTPEKVIEMMNDNYNEKIKMVNLDIVFFNKPIKDIITMASILEEEARTENTRRMIADILWRRIERGMSLQVDASFVYLLGKGSAELTVDDMKIDSPYNTYKYKGLPPGPITNPGLASILAATKPLKNKYWFYLSDKDGIMHYAVTFEEHKLNKERYLR
ncbi:MAG TPA: endolytic transglycosylase MltG [Candidatus Paceibacterota bacterium]|nr:endolytic transglycosylase MltG [Candidatus Paceibacterota bacterium]